MTLLVIKTLAMLLPVKTKGIMPMTFQSVRQYDHSLFIPEPHFQPQVFKHDDLSWVSISMENAKLPRLALRLLIGGLSHNDVMHEKQEITPPFDQ